LYAIKFTKDGLEDVKRLPKNIKNALKADLRAKLQVDPEGCSMELTDTLTGLRSYHWREHRIVFKLVEMENLIVIWAVDERAAQSKENIYTRLQMIVDEGKTAEQILVTLRGFSQRSKS